MPRLSILCCALTLALSGCATLKAMHDIDGPPEDSCLTDSQCLSGSCVMAKCSTYPRQDSATRGTPCSFASQCPGGSCQFGRCSQLPSSSSPTSGSYCTLGSDCVNGVCAGLDCR